ncbi:diguanylate cyclase (GGDEF)-like protein [Krasilnikovia cinnamomea]|uniref:Diguanylate cyclase (GGDEF)-like protein n=2 Tax=Krasilnikovia cinnamomea TaxID=349313 RepID=A0A4Q7ZH51_9ACTN|nr:diguanylate cyclase (GGDEF)-like protein [Krasilnikovia cinnamomea]
MLTPGEVQTSAGERAQQLLTELIAMETVPFHELEVARRARPTEIAREAAELGDIELWQRARLLAAYLRGRLNGDLAEMARTAQEVHQWAVENDRRQLLIRSHSVLGTLHTELGDAPTMLTHAVSAAELLTDDTPPGIRVGCLLRFGAALAAVGSHAESLQRVQQAEQFATDMGDLSWLRMALNDRAYTELEAGNPQGASETLERLMAAVTPAGIAFDLAMLHLEEIDTLAAVQIALGRYADAEQTMQSCLQLHEESGTADHYGHAAFLLTLAKAQRHLGKTRLAQQSLNRSSTICAEHDLADLAAQILREQAELHAATGDHVRAYDVLKDFLDASDKLRCAQQEAQARTRQAMFETAEARTQAAQFRDQARTDPLTGLRNRRYVDEHLPGMINEARTRGANLTVALADLDHFKRINDTLSHDAGDQVLTTVATILRDALAEITDVGFIARMGGEEFLLVLPDANPAAAAAHLDTLRLAIRNHHWQPITGDLPVTVSMGSTTTATAPDPTQAGMLADADRNLYAAKHAGRDRVINNPPPHQGTRRYRDAPKPS